MKFIYSILLVLFFCKLEAQTAAVDLLQLDDYYRVQQLLGSKDNRSFTIKPLALDPEYEDSINKSPFGREAGFNRQHKIADAFFYGVDMMQQYNSKLPWGWNEGGMIPAKGYQAMISTGFFARMGPLSISLKPELIYAQNPAFPTFPQQFPDAVWHQYYNVVLDKIDAPESFGSTAYKKLLPGQSYIQLKLGKTAISVSTENMWWEPGMRNSIMMSNSATGFLHVSFHSIRPIKTGIGSFEWQLIGGRLEHSGILPPDTARAIYNGRLGYHHKPNETRYINALIITWQPKWIRHFFLGVTRVVYEYDSVFKAAKGISKFLPIGQQLFGSGAQSVADNQDQIGSVFFRWFFPGSHTEIYGEYARNDHSANLRDLLQELNHSSAYTIGGRKLIILKPGSSKKQFYLDLFAEMTWLPLDLSHVLRPEESFYSHYQVWDGYTQQGQYIGAGIGHGGVSRTVDISLIKNSSKIGLMLEQRVHDLDFYNQTFTANVPYWIDYTCQLHAQKQFKQFFLSAELNYTKSDNYEWWRALPAGQNTGYADFGNIHGKLAIRVPL